MSAEQQVRYCGDCGAANPQGARYCNKCGRPLAVQSNPTPSTTKPYPQAPSAPKRRSSALRRLLRTAAMLVVAVILADVALHVFQNRSGSFPSLSSGSGTHICTTAHYDKKGLTCTSDDSTITALNKAYLSVTGKDGNNFTTSSLDVLINKRNGDGTYGQVASTKFDAGLSYNIVSNTLANVFLSASTAPDSGGTYQIEVDEGSINLGTATFTYKG